MTRIILGIFVLTLVAGCQTPTPLQTHNFNQAEVKEARSYYLDRDWDVYRKNLDDLVGHLIAVVPVESNATTIKYLGSIANNAATNSIEFQAFDELRYSSKVSGKFGGQLSFALGRVAFQENEIYDLILRDIDGYTIKPDEKHIDPKKEAAMLDVIPQQYVSLIFVTGIKHAILASRRFRLVSSTSEASYSIIKVDGQFYSSDETTQLDHVITMVGIERSAKFGVFNPQLKVFEKAATLISNAKPITQEQAEAIKKKVQSAKPASKRK